MQMQLRPTVMNRSLVITRDGGYVLGAGIDEADAVGALKLVLMIS